ncbi:MAG: hypothetical protein SOV90_10645 [Lachnospiraceae bacterium]|nr:hypothetical protein [Lachnospiraceae bacterium]
MEVKKSPSVILNAEHSLTNVGIDGYESFLYKLEIVVRGTPDSWDNLYVEKLLILHKSYSFFSTKLLFIISSVNGIKWKI